MRNLGPVSKKWLKEIGIHNINELKAKGAEQAYIELLANGVPENLNLLWSLYGAIHNKSWKDLSEEEKSKLKTKIN